MEAGREAKRLKTEDSLATTAAATSTTILDPGTANAMSSFNSLRPEDRTSSEMGGSEGMRTEMTSVSEADVVMQGVEQEVAQEAPREDGTFDCSASLYAPNMFTRSSRTAHARIRIVEDGAEDESIDVLVEAATLLSSHLLLCCA
jgi:hypothetical protein